MKIILLSLALAAVLSITACAAPVKTIPPTTPTAPLVLEKKPDDSLTKWMKFIRATDHLSDERLAVQKKYLTQRHHQENNHTNKMQLAYVMLLLADSINTLEQSDALLRDIHSDHPLAPIRDSLRREIYAHTLYIIAQQRHTQTKETLQNTQWALKQKKREVKDLKKQLQLLKAVDGDLTNIQTEIHKVSP